MDDVDGGDGPREAPEEAPEEAPAEAPAEQAAPTEVTPLRAPAHRVSRRSLRLWTLQGLGSMAVLLAVQVLWWLVDDAPGRGPHWVVGTVWLVTGSAYVVGMPRWRYRVHRWEATEHAIYTQSGWLLQERRIAPISRVQTVDLHRGPLAQLLGLASVTVTTASAAGPLQIAGLDLDVATRLVNSLTVAAIAERGDAT